ncbi:3-deoxy-D-manno-octulosonic acid kinase [Pelistega indica]|uniref:3-deoxy-D-manno-octulosonic acid kinase n=1 Tax=Pelistega indica TaxID=1414851 RepID=V8G8R1_9BURK|nr:3-deoxy-D-manno-octulosonic acid kinase [Pelistega indica]ETD72929.1 3-deoxy-D-manno-octulosonic acid kinase [Pelistega indica]
MIDFPLSLATDSRILCTWPEIAKQIDERYFALGGVNTTHFLPYSSIVPVSVGGRNAAWFVTHSLFKGVLRHYRRGGLIGKLIKNVYLWQGVEKTRSWSEYRVMAYLYIQNAPVPRPIAAFYHRQGLTYEAALITEQVENAQTLIAVLQKTSPDDYAQLAQQVVTAIKKMHALNVNHADLNAFNILINPQGEIYLIDFDKAKVETQQGTWCQHNLQRLERHLKKVLGEQGLAFMSHIHKKY